MQALKVRINNMRRLMMGKSIRQSTQHGSPGADRDPICQPNAHPETWKIFNGHSESLEELFNPISTYLFLLTHKVIVTEAINEVA